MVMILASWAVRLAWLPVGSIVLRAIVAALQEWWRKAELSADRANSVRKILEEEGVPTGNVFMVAGRADTQPLFPDDPFVAANRRVTITLMQEASPLPPSLKP